MAVADCMKFMDAGPAKLLAYVGLKVNESLVKVPVDPSDEWFAVSTPPHHVYVYVCYYLTCTTLISIPTAFIRISCTGL